MPIVLDHKALEGHLPHRGCNLLPDRVELSDDGKKAYSFARITAGDPRGREILGRRDGSGAACWYEPFLFEYLALTGIPLLSQRLAAAGQVAVFSSISRIAFHRQAPLHGELVGFTEMTRDRAPFAVFSSWAEINGVRIMEGEVMSGASTMEIGRAHV